MAVNTNKYIGQNYGTWLATGVAARRAKGGGVYLEIACSICGFKAEKDYMQLKHSAPKCPTCSTRDTKKGYAITVLVTGNVCTLVKRVAFDAHIANLSPEAILAYSESNTTVYTGFDGQQLREVESPWDVALLASRQKRAEARAQLIEELRIEAEMEEAGSIVNNSIPDKLLRPERQEYLEIETHDRLIFEGKSTAAIPPKYIAEWALKHPKADQYTYTFSRAPLGKLYVYWTLQGESIEDINPSLIVPDFGI